MISTRTVESIDLSTRIGQFDLAFPAMNASGPLCTYDDELNALAESASGAIVWKSMTLEARLGNPQPRLSWNTAQGTSINSIGLANLGYRAHAEQIARLREIHPQRRLIASIAALEPTQFPIMTKQVGAVADALEINLSCPNVPGKPQLAFDLEASRATLLSIRESTECDLWVKLPPFQDARLVEAMATVLVEAQVQAAVCINSPSGLDLDLDGERALIHPNRGMGGAGGRDILRIARWNIRQFFLALDGRASVVGVGGIFDGRDIYGHILCGASAVQIGTSYLIEGPAIFSRVRREFLEVLHQHGVTRLQDKIGALKIPEKEISS